MPLDTLPLTASEADGLRRIISQLDAVNNAIGGWTSSVQARQTGLSLHLRFEKKTSVQQALEFSEILERAPGFLYTTCEKLLSAFDANA